MKDTAPTTFGSALTAHARQRGDQVALHYNARITNFATLDAHASQVAQALIACGVGHGDRIAFIGRNSDLAVELVFGAARIGAVMVPIIWRLAPAEVDWILADSGARILFADADFLGCGTGQPGLLRVVMDADGLPPAIPAQPCFTSWRDAQAATDPGVAVDAADPVLQIYTSGTTGRPKGAILRHRNCIAYRKIVNAAGFDWLTPRPGSTVLMAMPFGHIAGVGQIVLAVYDGQQLIIHADFDPAALLAAIPEHRLERLFLVPAALRLLLAHPDAQNTDFSSLRYFFYGASPIPVDLLKAGIAALGCGFVQLYGMTETWGSVVALAPEDHDLARPHLLASAGRAMPGVRVAILGPAGDVLPPGLVGEIAIHSPSNMLGYWNRADETAKTLTGDGWILTGDAGLLDGDGYLFIQDRIKDMIISGGENIYPAEVESALYGHPDVADVAVIGVPDAKWGEAVKAIIVLMPGVTPDGAAIIAHARERIAGFKCPKSVEFITELPRNPSGKILRRALRDPYWEGYERRVN